MNPWDDPEQERQREPVRRLVAERRFTEAAALMAPLPDDILVYSPCEEVADHIMGQNPELARRLYGIAIETHRREGYLATGSGEGLVSVMNRERVEKKRARLG
jgi:hypothetical protein